MAYFHRYSAAARCVPPTAAAKYLAREDVCGRQNAVARQRFCPLQRFELVTFFRGVGRTRNGTGRKVSASDLFAVVSLLAAAFRTESLLSRPALNLAATTGASYRRVTPMNSIARGLALIYFLHVEISCAGFARQCGPAFFLPAPARSVGWLVLISAVRSSVPALMARPPL
jgi:hypothetical protein